MPCLVCATLIKHFRLCWKSKVYVAVHTNQVRQHVAQLGQETSRIFRREELSGRVLEARTPLRAGQAVLI